MVHGLLRDQGLMRFYEIGGSKAGAVGQAPREATLDWLPDLEAKAAAEASATTMRLTVDVQGIRCTACVWLLQTLWKRQPGARELRVDPSLGRATLTYDRGGDTAARFLAAAARFGYPMAPPSRRITRDTGLLTRLGICVALAMNAMLLAVCSYFGLDAGDGAGDGDGGLHRLFENVLLGLGTASVLVGGPVFFRAAIAGLRHGLVHMDLPISIGLLLAWAGSVYGWTTGGSTWFDTVSIFVAFMLGGRFLQQRTLAQSRDQVLADDGAEHLRARRVKAGRIELVPVRSIAAGDELMLAPGDLVPVRARLTSAAGAFSLDWISGESEPRPFKGGEVVPAGAFQAGRAAVRVVATDDYQSSGLAELFGREPIDREDTRGRVRFWDRLSRSYSAGVLLAAALGAALWACIDPAQSLPVAISVLVITCPCAMGIATPLAFHLALALLRRRGVFVRSRTLLDKVRCVRKVVFDKTGTLTLGGLRAEPTLPPAEAVVPVLATMVASSNHPVSHAILHTLRDAPVLTSLEVTEVAGQGLECVYGGERWRLGGRQFCGQPGNTKWPPLRRECLLTRGSELVARYEIEEDFRAGAAEEIAALRRRGIEVHLMSGDRPDRVRRAAAMLGVPPECARGGMAPDDKAAAIEALGADDLMMIGDGINDAPAFATAFCAGTPAMDRPVLPARADFCFRGEHAGAVAAVFDVAELHASVVRTNLALALAYNATTLVTSFLAAMTPGLCAVLMPLSSAALILHTSTRLARARRRA